jgi:aminoglycoside phosphotransferase family enzyme/predicted kinase
MGTVGLPAHIVRFAERHAAAGPFDLKQTHASWVLVGRALVYKFKKPLDLGFLDYSSLANRQRMCEEERRLNDRLAPGVYLDVQPVDAQGGRGGQAIDYALVMRRLPDELMLDRVLAAGAVPAGAAKELARRLVAFHREAVVPATRGTRALGQMFENWEDNFRRAAAMPEEMDLRLVEQVRAFFESFRVQRARLLAARHAARTVDGHSDLRAEHVCLTDPPVFFDCVEFSEELRTVDAASDLAFLLMDLEALGRRPFADALCAAYLYESRDETLPPVLDFYRCYRAFIRAMVEAIRARAGEVPEAEQAQARLRARNMLLLSRHYARPTRLILVHGYSGTGKSTIAARVASAGSVALLATDVVRKERLGLHPSDPLPAPGFRQGAFAAQPTREVYDEVVRRALGYLMDGVSVVVDGTFLYTEGRDAAAALCEAWPGPKLALLMDPSEDRVRGNLARRAARPDASLAGLDAYETQRHDQPDPTLPGFWTLRLQDEGCDLGGRALLAALPEDFAPR